MLAIISTIASDPRLVAFDVMKLSPPIRSEGPDGATRRWLTLEGMHPAALARDGPRKSSSRDSSIAEQPFRRTV